MNSIKRKSIGMVGTVLAVLSLNACISKDVEMTEQQKRMQRCDQYVDMAREQCLQGMNVTIQDYQEEFRNFEKSQQAELEAQTKAIEAAVARQEAIKAEKLKEALKKAEEKAKQAEQNKDKS
jgi:membrane protein involved in colicin uptake